MIDAVESNSKEIHGRSEKIKLKERVEPDRMAANEESKTDERVSQGVGKKATRHAVGQQSSKLPAVGPTWHRR